MTISKTPWTYRPDDKAVFQKDGRVVVYGAVYHWEQVDANGHLIAAAPELQAALRELVAVIGEHLPASVIDTLEPEVTGAQAALRKAEGK